MRAVGRDEVQLDPLACLLQPLPHGLCVMAPRIVEKNVNYPVFSKACQDRGQHGDSAGRIDTVHQEHLGLASFKIDRALDIDVLAAGGLFHRNRQIRRRPAADRLRAMHRVHSVAEHHHFVGGQAVQQIFDKPR